MSIFGWDVLKRLSIILNSTPSADQSGGPIVEYVTCGETLAVGKAVYIKSDGKAWKADANSTTTMPAVAVMLQAGVADQSRKALYLGIMRNDAWNWTVGGQDGIIYVSATAGALTQTAPAATGDQVQTMGIATHADRMYVCPNHVLVEVP